MGTFEFVVLAALRVKQLKRGCLPRVTGNHKPATIAQIEVAEGKVFAEVHAVVDAVAVDLIEPVLEPVPVQAA
jgi:DNA-directed RNA polymerase subunit K/omega